MLTEEEVDEWRESGMRVFDFATKVLYPRDAAAKAKKTL